MKDKLLNLTFLIIALLVITFGVSFSYLKKGIYNNDIANSIININQKDYAFVGNEVNNVTIVLDKQNVPYNSYASNNITINTSTLSSSDDYACSFDLYYVWDDEPFINDFTLSTLRPFELSSVVYLGNTVVGQEVSLGNTPLNPDNNLYEVKIASNLTTITGTPNNYVVNIRAYNYSGQTQTNLVNNTKEGHIEIRDVKCKIALPVLFNFDGSQTLLSFAQTKRLINDSNTIRSIHVVDTNVHPVPSGKTTADFSKNLDNSVVGWIENTNELYIGGNGGVASDNSLLLAFAGSTNPTETNFKSNLRSIYFDAFDTTNTNLFVATFYGNPKLNFLDVSNFDTSNATDMQSMFYGLNNVNQLDVSNFNTSKVTNMMGMFYEIYNIKDIDVSNFDTSNVTDMGAMFYQDRNLQNVDVSNWDTSKVSNLSMMFFNAKSIKKMNVSNWNTSNVTAMYGIFSNLSNINSLDVSHFDTKKVTNMWAMFGGLNNVSTIDVSNFNTSNVTDMTWMFSECKKVTSLNVENFDTKKVTNMYSMFINALLITSLNVNNFNTSNVTNMSRMFAGMGNITTLNLSSFNLVKVTDISYMMAYMPKLNKLYLGQNFWTRNENVAVDNFMYKDAPVLATNIYNSPGNFRNALPTGSVAWSLSNRSVTYISNLS